MEKTKILHQALSEMEERFTSYDFSKSLRRLGVVIRKNDHARYIQVFLLRYATQGEGNKWWYKKKEEKQLTTRGAILQAVEMFYTAEETAKAITILKSQGYKISKPTTQWEEV